MRLSSGLRSRLDLPSARRRRGTFVLPVALLPNLGESARSPVLRSHVAASRESVVSVSLRRNTQRTSGRESAISASSLDISGVNALTGGRRVTTVRLEEVLGLRRVRVAVEIRRASRGIFK